MRRLILVAALAVAVPPLHAQDAPSTDRTPPFLIPALLASGIGAFAGWQIGGHSTDDEPVVGAALFAMVTATTLNAAVLSVASAGKPNLGETLANATASTISGIGLGLLLGGLSDRERGTPEGGLWLGFTIGQGIPTAWLATRSARRAR